MFGEDTEVSEDDVQFQPSGVTATIDCPNCNATMSFEFPWGIIAQMARREDVVPSAVSSREKWSITRTETGYVLMLKCEDCTGFRMRASVVPFVLDQGEVLRWAGVMRSMRVR